MQLKNRQDINTLSLIKHALLEPLSWSFQLHLDKVYQNHSLARYFQFSQPKQVGIRLHNQSQAGICHRLQKQLFSLNNPLIN